MFVDIVVVDRESSENTRGPQMIPLKPRGASFVGPRVPQQIQRFLFRSTMTSRSFRGPTTIVFKLYYNLLALRGATRHSSKVAYKTRVCLPTFSSVSGKQ